MRGIADPTRVAAMVELYKAGRTYRSIGAEFGCTRQNVEQLISRSLASYGGGRAVRAALGWHAKVERRERAQVSAETTTQRRWGMTVAQYRAHVDEHGSSTRRGSPLHRFIEHRRNARRRGIAWQMTFAEWWGIWNQSGRWHQRSRTADGLVMARYGDSGAYAPDNVYICTLSENSRHHFLVDHAKKRKSAKVCAMVTTL